MSFFKSLMAPLLFPYLALLHLCVVEGAFAPTSLGYAAGHIQSDGAPLIYTDQGLPVDVTKAGMADNMYRARHNDLAIMRREGTIPILGNTAGKEISKHLVGDNQQSTHHHSAKANNSHAPSMPNNSSNNSQGISASNATTMQAKAEKERMRYRSLAMYVFPISACLALLFEKYHWRWCEVNWGLQLEWPDGRGGSELVDNSFRGLTTGLVSRAASLCRIYFNGAGQRKGRAYLLMLFLHNALSKYLGLAFFAFTQRFWNLYRDPSMPLFFALVVNWIILYTVSTLTAVYSNYTMSIMRLHWQDHMTRYFERIWLPNCYLFRLMNDKKLDNPDQRIQEDIQEFIGGTCDRTLGLWNALSDLAIYGFMLVRLSPTSFFGICNIPGWLVYVAILYAGVGSLAMQYFGADLAHLSWLDQRYAGDLRAELRQAFEQGETTAAVRAQESEFSRLQTRFDYLKLVMWKKMILNKQLSWWRSFYDPLNSLLFMIVLMPYFIRGQMDLGRVKQCQSALGTVSGSLNFFSDNYGSLATYRAAVDRLYNFRVAALANMKEASMPFLPEIISELVKIDGVSISSDVPLAGASLALKGLPDLPLGEHAQGPEDGDIFPRSSIGPPAQSNLAALELRDATIMLPSGQPVLHRVSVRVSAGKCVLISGKEGSGKSTLLRTLAGIWPFIEPSACRICSDETNQATMLIPQKPRLPAPMTLAEAVCYPNKPGTFSDSAIMESLEQVKLAELGKAYLNVTIDVNSILSGGEFQRVMIAHCLLAKPQWILLDESMAHLSSENQHDMYQLLREELVSKHGTSLVSTSHEWAALVGYHDVHLTITSDDNKTHEASPGTLRPFITSQPLASKALLPEREAMLRMKIARQAEDIAVLRQRVSEKKRARDLSAYTTGS